METCPLREKNEKAKAAGTCEKKHRQRFVRLLRITISPPTIVKRKAWKIATVPFMASIVIASTVLFAVNASGTSDQSGLLFQKTWSSKDFWSSADVAIDSLDNVYVTGSVSRYDSANHEYTVVFLLKCDPTGTLVWQRIWSGNFNSTSYPSAVAVDTSGNIYVTGSTSSLPFAGINDIFLLKFNALGSLVWQRTYGSSSNDEGFGVAVDTSGYAYVTGGIGFGRGSWDVLLLKFDPSGNLLWQKTWGGISSDHGVGVAVDSSDSIYVAGTTTGTNSSFGTGLSNILLLKFDSSGGLIWQKIWDPTKYAIATANDIAVDSSDSIYVTGFYANPVPYDILLLKFDSSGSLIWQRTCDIGSWDRAEDVAVDSSGGIYVAGSALTQGGYDVLLVKFDSSGNHAGIVIWGNTALGVSQKGSGVAMDSFGNAVVTGFVDLGPPYTMIYLNGTIDSPTYSLGVPSFTLDTPTFPMNTPTGIVETPSLNESHTGKISGLFLVKFTPISYTESFAEKSANVFGPPSALFYGITGSALVLIGTLAIILFIRRREPQAEVELKEGVEF